MCLRLPDSPVLLHSSQMAQKCPLIFLCLTATSFQILRLQLHSESVDGQRENLDAVASLLFLLVLLYFSFSVYRGLFSWSIFSLTTKRLLKFLLSFFRSFVLALHTSILNNFYFEEENCFCEDTHQISNFVTLALWKHKKICWFLNSPYKVLYWG